MATVRRPNLPGMSVSERPMSASQARTFGVQPPAPAAPDPRPRIDDEVRQRTQQMRTARTAPTTPSPASSTAGAAPSGAAPAQTVASKMSAISQRAGAGLTSFARRAASSIRGAGPMVALGAGATALSNMDLKQPTAQISTADYLNGTVPEDVVNTSTNESVGSAVEIDQRRRTDPSTVEPVASAAAPSAIRAAGIPGGRSTMVERPDRTDRDPTSQAFGASRDFTAELASVPRTLPGDLRRGVINKTMDANGRPVYSGVDVGANAQMVDGMGRTVQGGGTVSTVPGMSQDEIDRTLQRGRYAAPEPSAGGSQPPGGFSASGGLLDTPKARRAAEALRQGSEQLANQRRGQDITRDTTMAEIGDRRAARGEKAAAAAAQQARQAAFVRAAGGDPARAAQLALQAGDLEASDALGGAADSADSRATTRRSTVEDFLKPLSTATDEDGKGRVDDALLQRNMDTLQSLASTQGVSVDELLADESSARAAIKVINGINSTRKNTIGKAIGLDDAPVLRQIPATPAGATSTERVGLIRGALTPGVSWGDRRFSTKAGDFYLPDEIWQDEDVQKFFNARMGK